jgi:hypothetical protein
MLSAQHGNHNMLMRTTSELPALHAEQQPSDNRDSGQRTEFHQGTRMRMRVLNPARIGSCFTSCLYAAGTAWQCMQL